MESQSDQTSPQTADAESTMRQNLGLNGSASSSANDPLKAARQAIRSQTAAREYAEQQLVQVQSAIQDLRSRLHHTRHEKDAAIAAVQSATAAKDAAERSVRAAESALANERANRVRVEGMLRDAEVTVRDLREKLAAANQTLRATQAEMATERQARSLEDVAVIVVPEVATPTVRDSELPVVRRPVGRPRKMAVMGTV
jgi:chromosome segregation ATPase